MSATEEVAAPAVEDPPVTEEPKKAEEKPEREKKLKDLKEKKPKPKTAAHPPYFQMIKEALLTLDEKSGSSPYAIAKYMEENYKGLPANFRKTLALQLKNSETRGNLLKIKASYKLSEAVKKEESIDIEKRTTRASTMAASAPKKKQVKKNKKKKKKKTSSAAKMKQPKSIKSPGAKKPKKAAA